MKCRLSSKLLLVVVVPGIFLVLPIIYLVNRCPSPCSSLQIRQEHVSLSSGNQIFLGQSTTVKNPSSISRDSNNFVSELDNVSPESLFLSEHPDIDIRAKFQRKQISRFCAKYKLKGELRLPVSDELTYYFRHFLFDDQRKVLFCFVPKIGCTNLKRLMLYMSGHLPLSTVDWPWVEDHIYLEPALKHASLMNKTLSTRAKIERWNNYYKFMFVRNPLERLVSGFRNKIEPPLSFKRQGKFPDFVKLSILNQYRQGELLEWKRAHRMKNGNPPEISVTFQEFVRSLIEESNPQKLNEHFRPSIDVCHPCLARFHFYGNFRNISSDVKQLIKKFGTEQRFYRDHSIHNSTDQTYDKLREYYGQLTQRDKLQLIGRLYEDLLFYYTLYPSQRWSHYELLGIKHPIT